jgi:hypothetical protein
MNSPTSRSPLLCGAGGIASRYGSRSGNSALSRLNHPAGVTGAESSTLPGLEECPEAEPVDWRPNQLSDNDVGSGRFTRRSMRGQKAKRQCPVPSPLRGLRGGASTMAAAGSAAQGRPPAPGPLAKGELEPGARLHRRRRRARSLEMRPKNGIARKTQPGSTEPGASGAEP